MSNVTLQVRYPGNTTLTITLPETQLDTFHKAVATKGLFVAGKAVVATESICWYAQGILGDVVDVTPEGSA